MFGGILSNYLLRAPSRGFSEELSGVESGHFLYQQKAGRLERELSFQRWEVGPPKIYFS